MTTHLEIDVSSSFYPSIDRLDIELGALFAHDDVNAVLEKIQAFVQAIILDRRAVAKVFADSTLDRWCQRIGAATHSEVMRRPPATETERPDCVFLATELYRTGGHTAVMEDLVRTGKFGPRTVIMLTDALHTADPSIIADRFGLGVRGEVAPSGSLAEKLSWTLTRLAALRPRRLVLFNHHHDPVAIAAAQPAVAGEVVFYHHADHQLCLGVTLRHTLHVDPHPMGFHHCRKTLHIDSNVYWPLAVDDLGAVPPPAATTSSIGLRTCSSGSHNKFEHDYRYQYADLLPQILAATHGTHVHIGPLSDETIARIYTGLEARQIERAHFVYVPWVASMWHALRDQKIDLYIASFPLGGGRVLIEAMGAGVPMIAHDCYRSPFMGGKDMLYREAFVWQRPEQLLHHLAHLQRQDLIAEGKAARDHYDRFHTHAALVACIDAGHAASDAPLARPHNDDPLQEFLDDVQYAVRDHLTSQTIVPVLERSRQIGEVQKAQTDALRMAYAHQMFALLGSFTESINQLQARLRQYDASFLWRLFRVTRRALLLLRGQRGVQNEME